MSGREIPVQGSERPAVVDDEDFDRVLAFAWRLKGGYPQARQRVGGRKRIHFDMHRLVMGLEVGDPRRLDHINRDPMDNRRSNLRFATQQENAQNQGAHKRWGAGPSCDIRGVQWSSAMGKWRSVVRVNGKNHYLGWFDDPEEAGAVAAAFRSEHMPFTVER